MYLTTHGHVTAHSLWHNGKTHKTAAGDTDTLVVRTAVSHSICSVDHLHYLFLRERESAHTVHALTMHTHSNTHTHTHTHTHSRAKPLLNHILKRAGVHRVRPVPRGLIGRVVDIVVTATTRVIGLGPPAGQRRLAWLGVGLKLGLGRG